LQHVNAITVDHPRRTYENFYFYGITTGRIVLRNLWAMRHTCPTAALTERRYFDYIWEAIGDEKKQVIINTAPSVRVAIGETLGYPPGTRVTGKMVTALKKMGFDSVLDTNFTADLTIIEEGTELLHRLRKALLEKEKVALPMITSCSPGWVKFIEHM
jgi:NADH-quinone oxidoreductase subunit G/[NiFe] hydrogenase diaphorase moiety small subunit/NADP-reducing hydrogenase subunit HndD